jgi:hypothetical protein
MVRSTSMTTTDFGGTDTLWACGELDACFKGAPRIIVPWPSAGRRKSEPRVPVAIENILTGPPRLHEVDPRTLFASQPWVLRSHAAYYLTGEWELTGRTSADMHSSANRYPTFAERRGQLVIVTGHHRSLAALIEGRPVLARVVADEPLPVSITPHVAISNDQEISDDDIDALTNRLLTGERITVGGQGAAAEILRRVGLSEHEVADRLRHAGL